MKIEKLRNNHKKEIIIGILLLVVIGGALTYKLTHSKYRYTQSIDLGSGVINYTSPDFKIMAVKISDDGENYNDSNEIPTSGYTLNSTKSICNIDNVKDSNISIEYSNGKVNFLGVSKKGTKCYLYFDKIIGKSIDNIIASLNAKTSTPTFSSIATSDEGVYATSDGTNMYGTNTTTYYWRGAATTNHVIFANKCWRIVRINGDKTMRLIYNGAVQSGNTCTGNGSNADSIAVTDQVYNSGYYQSNYVGWTYEEKLQRPSSITSGAASYAKAQTENWYNSNIGNNSAYSAKVADGKFCNDRNVASGYSWALKPSNVFYYAAYERLATNKTPTFSCSNSEDVYTLKVGAITADEVAFAGGVHAEGNLSYYLYNGQNYWTMSPFYWYIWGSDTRANVFYVNSNGVIADERVNGTIGLRPVINLKADTQFATNGTGTQNSPYVVS